MKNIPSSSTDKLNDDSENDKNSPENKAEKEQDLQLEENCKQCHRKKITPRQTEKELRLMLVKHLRLLRL